MQNPGHPEARVFDRVDEPIGRAGLGDVAGDHLDPVARGIQFRHFRGHVSAGSRTPVQDNQSRTLPHEPLRDDEAEAAHAADDEVAAVRAHQWLRRRRRQRFDGAVRRYRHGDLAGVPAGCHQGKGVRRVLEGERGDGKHPQGAVGDVPEDLGQHRAVPGRLQLQIQVEVDDREGRAFGQCGQSQVGVGVDVLLAQLDEPAAGARILTPR